MQQQSRRGRFGQVRIGRRPVGRLALGLALVALAAFAQTASASSESAEGARTAATWFSITINPSSHDYGTIDAGATASQTFVVKNNGRLPTSKLKVSLAGSSAFSKTSDTCAGKFLWPRKQCSITIEYAPTGADSTDSGSLKVAGLKVTATATLTGKSAQPAPEPTCTQGGEDFFYDPVGSKPTMLTSGTIDGPYGGDDASFGEQALLGSTTTTTVTICTPGLPRIRSGSPSPRPSAPCSWMRTRSPAARS